MLASAASPGFVQQLRHERTLLWCVLASIVLHVLVLLGVSPEIALAPPAKTLLVLTARLAPVAAVPQPPSPQPAPVVPSKPTPVAPPPKPAPKPEPKLETVPMPKPATAPRPAPEKPVIKPEAVSPKPAAESPKPAATEPTTDTATAATSARPAPAGSAFAAPAGAAVESPAPSVSEADKGTLERYRLALIVATRRYKRYPAIALEKGWQGRVEVHMVIGANGMLASTSIKTSSGHEILDNQALDMLKKGKTTVQVPPSLRGREFSVDVPVVFNLDNPNS